MRPHLLFPDADLDTGVELPAAAEETITDLDLTTVLSVMAGGDTFVSDICRRVLLTPVIAPDVAGFRQRALADCLAHPDVVGRIYQVTLKVIETERHALFGLSRTSPTTALTRSTSLLADFRASLQTLRGIADAHHAEFTSACWREHFAMLQRELDDDYLAELDQRLDALRFRHGMVFSARLDDGLVSADLTLRHAAGQHWWQRLTEDRAPGYSFVIPERDEAGFRALGDLEGRGLYAAAVAISRAADHVLAFFTALRAELAFYLGCANLHAALTDQGRAVCWPDPRPTAGRPAGALVLRAAGLYDAGLALRTDGEVVGNDVDADGASLVMITGANQGGKSTFVRALGQAQLMMQAGMFVAATGFAANVCTAVFTHFIREEDAGMDSGKLDEELSRMNDVVTVLRPGALVVCNESFAATNEREGSQIAREIITALVDSGVKVYFVTHLYDLAAGLFRDRTSGAVFLRAERGPGGRRTYKLSPGEPLPTSFGRDTYTKVFG